MWMCESVGDVGRKQIPLALINAGNPSAFAGKRSLHRMRNAKLAAHPPSSSLILTILLLHLFLPLQSAETHSSPILFSPLNYIAASGPRHSWSLRRAQAQAGQGSSARIGKKQCELVYEDPSIDLPVSVQKVAAGLRSRK
jgi:hypothetical protein